MIRTKLKVNDPCPCHSGKKYKKCFGNKNSNCYLKKERFNDKECIFCLNKIEKRAKEHVIPEWLSSYMNIGKIKVIMKQISPFGLEKNIRKNLTLGSLIEGRVCENCNNGWMRKLEDGNKDILEKLISGKKKVSELIDKEKELLGKWMIKTAYVFNSSSNYSEKVVPSHLYYLSLDQIPDTVFVLANSVIWDGLEKNEFNWIQKRVEFALVKKYQELVAINYLKNAYHITMQFGHLIFSVINNPFRRGILIIDILKHKVIRSKNGVIQKTLDIKEVDLINHLKNLEEKKKEYIIEFNTSVTIDSN